MSGRLRVGLGTLAVTAGLCLLGASAALGSYDVTATCESNGLQVQCAGWHVSPVQMYWTWTPSTSGTGSPGCVTQTFASDIATTIDCEVTGPDGIGETPQVIDVEISTPTASVVFARPPDASGWYADPVAVSFAGSSFSGITSCSPTLTYSGPDTSGTPVSGSCLDNAGKSASTSLSLRYDATPPTVTGVIPSRSPDFNGWYNRPVTFAFEGTDALSGIDTCDTVTYSGPDTANGSVVGSCRDGAGNVATRAVPLRYDATPPPLGVAADPGDGRVIIDAQTSASLSSFSISRSPGLHGAQSSVLERGGSRSYRDTRVRNHVRYRYTIAARDQAGNISVRTIVVTPGPRLLAPASGSTLSTPVLLHWTAVRGASYYNVQLWRGGKILSVWPSRSSFLLPSDWSFAGRHFRLRPGRYRWFVWPGFGSRAAARYGPMIGGASFVVSRRT
jgi:hypothetical protein